jgi:hypothetical protein
MWNYLSGVKPPSESEKKKEVWKYHIEYYNRYDKDKCARKYLPEWENLKYVDNKGMACTACNEFGEPNGITTYHNLSNSN